MAPPSTILALRPRPLASTTYLSILPSSSSPSGVCAALFLMPGPTRPPFWDLTTNTIISVPNSRLFEHSDSVWVNQAIGNCRSSRSSRPEMQFKQFASCSNSVNYLSVCQISWIQALSGGSHISEIWIWDQHENGLWFEDLTWPFLVLDFLDLGPRGGRLISFIFIAKPRMLLVSDSPGCESPSVMQARGCC
jgi:hypothetical protein